MFNPAGWLYARGLCKPGPRPGTACSPAWRARAMKASRLNAWEWEHESHGAAEGEGARTRFLHARVVSGA